MRSFNIFRFIDRSEILENYLARSHSWSIVCLAFRYRRFIRSMIIAWIKSQQSLSPDHLPASFCQPSSSSSSSLSPSSSSSSFNATDSAISDQLLVFSQVSSTQPTSKQPGIHTNTEGSKDLKNDCSKNWILRLLVLRWILLLLVGWGRPRKEERGGEKPCYNPEETLFWAAKGLRKSDHHRLSMELNFIRSLISRPI